MCFSHPISHSKGSPKRSGMSKHVLHSGSYLARECVKIQGSLGRVNPSCLPGYPASKKVTPSCTSKLWRVSCWYSAIGWIFAPSWTRTAGKLMLLNCRAGKLASTSRPPSKVKGSQPKESCLDGGLNMLKQGGGTLLDFSKRKRKGHGPVYLFQVPYLCRIRHSSEKRRCVFRLGFHVNPQGRNKHLHPPPGRFPSPKIRVNMFGASQSDSWEWFPFQPPKEQGNVRGVTIRPINPPEVRR